MNISKILVTGGAGFIGSHLTETLVNLDCNVVVLDNFSAGNKLPNTTRKNIQLIDGDVRNLKTVLDAAVGCDAIIHLAAVVGVEEVIKRKVEVIETETVGTHNIVLAAQQHNIGKIIYASSSAVYKNVKGVFSCENDSLDLVSTYAIAKRLNEKYLESVTLEHGISTISLRFFNVYGGRQDRRMVIPRFFEQALTNQSISVFGAGQQTRDFTHIDDIVKGIVSLTFQSGLQGVYNISRGVETTILELAQKIKKITCSNSTIELLDFPQKRISFKVDRRVGSSEKLFQDTGVKPGILLEEGLQICYESSLQPLRSAI